MASHCQPAAAQRRNRSASMLLPHGHVYIHEDRGMPCLNLVCGAEGFGSAILIRAGVPVIGIQSLTDKRPPKIEKFVRLLLRRRRLLAHLDFGQRLKSCRSESKDVSAEISSSMPFARRTSLRRAISA
jgi:3-methyladenine DNA glycosylase Mpg